MKACRFVTPSFLLLLELLLLPLLLPYVRA